MDHWEIGNEKEDWIHHAQNRFHRRLCVARYSKRLHSVQLRGSDQLSLSDSCHFTQATPMSKQYQCLEKNHNRFLPHPFQFITPSQPQLHNLFRRKRAVNLPHNKPTHTIPYSRSSFLGWNFETTPRNYRHRVFLSRMLLRNTQLGAYLLSFASQAHFSSARANFSSVFCHLDRLAVVSSSLANPTNV